VHIRASGLLHYFSELAGLAAEVAVRQFRADHARRLDIDVQIFLRDPEVGVTRDLPDG